WWRRRRGLQAERDEADAENVRRSIAASTKMCRECRALIPASAAVCPECGARTSHIRSGGARRALASILPFEPTVSMLLVSSFFVLFLAGLFLSMRLSETDPEGGNPLGFVMNLDGRALLATGANTGSYFQEISSSRQPWRLLTAVFLHAGLL